MPLTESSPLSPPERMGLPPVANAPGSLHMREERPRARRPWRDKFRVALRGLKLGVRGHSSFAVHFFFTALVLAAAIVFRCTLTEWCLLLGCIGLVLVAELFNSAIETLFRGLDETTQTRTWPCLDVSAGAVLLASITAAVVGAIIFLGKLAVWLNFTTM